MRKQGKSENLPAGKAGFKVQSLLLMVLVLAAVFFTTAIPAYATHDPDCTDMSDLDCKVCPDEYGDHHILGVAGGTIWEGTCRKDKAKRIIYACDASLNIDEQPDRDDPTCIQDGTIPAPASNIKDIFGKVVAPVELNPFIAKGGNGAGGISAFVNMLIRIIFVFGSIVFIFMILWGALQWTMSGGDKESVAAARRRITYAFIGITLFAIAFAVIRVIGIFTGFEFVNRQNASCSQREDYYWQGTECWHVFYPDAACTAVFEKVDNGFCPADVTP